MVRAWLFYRKLVFEIIPLTFNVVSTLALLLLKLFEKGYEFDLIGQMQILGRYLIEIFTYFLFAFTFAVILSKTKSSHHPSLRMKYLRLQNRIYIVTFILIVAILIVFIFLVTFKVVERNCDQNLILISIITLSCEAITYVPALYNARKIIHLLNRKKHTSLTQTMLSQQASMKQSLSDQFTIERKKQIFAVLLIYTLSLLIRITLLIITVAIDGSDLIRCKNLQGMMIITSDDVIGQIVLILIQINQLLPHIIIPIALFIIPMKSKFKTQGLAVKKQNQFLENSDEEDNLDSRDQIITSRVSTVFSDKRSATSSVFSDKVDFPVK